MSGPKDSRSITILKPTQERWTARIPRPWTIGCLVDLFLHSQKGGWTSSKERRNDRQALVEVLEVIRAKEERCSLVEKQIEARRLASNHRRGTSRAQLHRDTNDEVVATAHKGSSNHKGINEIFADNHLAEKDSRQVRLGLN
jgi:hypothetical protein